MLYSLENSTRVIWQTRLTQKSIGTNINVYLNTFIPRNGAI